MIEFQTLTCKFGAVQKVRVLQVRSRKDLFNPRRCAAVKVHPNGVEHKAEGGLTRSTGVKRTKAGILDTHQRHQPPRCCSLATPGGRASTPDQNPVITTRQSEAQIMACQCKYPVQPTVAKERQILVPDSSGNPRQKRVHVCAFQDRVSCR